MRIEYLAFFKNVDGRKETIFYLCGPEPFLKRRARERLIGRPDFKGYARSRFQAPSLNLAALWEKIAGRGLFSMGEVIVLDRVEKLSAANKKSLLELIDRWEESAAQGTILIFVSDSEKKPDPADPLEGRMMASPAACHVFLPELRISEVASWARGELKRRQIEISASALDHACGVLANELHAWNNLIVNLDLSLGIRRRASLEDVTELLEGASIDQERIRRRFYDRALDVMIAKENSGELLCQFLSDVEDIMAKSPQGETPAALGLLRGFADWTYEMGLAKAGGYSSRRKRDPDLDRRLMASAKRWSWDEVIRLYDSLIVAERRIKTGFLPPETVIRQLVLNIFELPASLRGGNGSAAVI
ncbi:MAG: hypothetical protein HY547_07320 [Elusimicrobia bacterium]|nr:hypothetical protein [Elusimicrobiota bacterium]